MICPTGSTSSTAVQVAFGLGLPRLQMTGKVHFCSPALTEKFLAIIVSLCSQISMEVYFKLK